jgi:hypothetical protein
MGHGSTLFNVQSPTSKKLAEDERQSPEKNAAPTSP